MNAIRPLHALVALVGASALAGAADVVPPVLLDLPLACEPGRSCWVANYADTDPSAAATDFSCGPRAYEGHDGVDFAIRDLGEMARGVTVLAAAAGVVRGARDGVADVAAVDAESRARVAGRECGNGVLLEHGEGWQTQYCHLRRGSVGVRPGQRVAAGEPLGLVGLSGQTEFPHLHLAVRHNGVARDPFTGAALADGCGTRGAGLWVDMFGVRAGDRLHFRITGPDGRPLVDSVQPIERTQARRFVFVGSRRQAAAWPAGTYRGEIVHQRLLDGQPRQSRRELGVELR